MDVRKAIHNIISALLATFGITLVVLTLLFNPIVAQTVSERLTHVEDQIADLGRRQDSLEKLNIDSRLTKIETLLSYASWLNCGSAAGTGSLIIHALYLSKKKKREE